MSTLCAWKLSSDRRPHFRVCRATRPGVAFPADAQYSFDFPPILIKSDLSACVFRQEYYYDLTHTNAARHIHHTNHIKAKTTHQTTISVLGLCFITSIGLSFNNFSTNRKKICVFYLRNRSQTHI